MGTRVIASAHQRAQLKTLRKIRRRRERRKRLTAGLRALQQKMLLGMDLLQGKPETAVEPVGSQRRFDDVVMDAITAEEVTRSFAALPPDTNLTCELERAIEARHKRLQRDMGFATTGLRRMVCLGALCMSAVGLALAVSGLHLGALSLACGAAVLAVFIVMAVVTYGYRCLMYRHTEKGRAELAQHRAVLKALRQLCDEQRIMPDRESRVTLDRCVSVINGNVGFVVLEVLRGTMLEPMVTLWDMVRRKLQTRRMLKKVADLATLRA